MLTVKLYVVFHELLHLLLILNLIGLDFCPVEPQLFSLGRYLLKQLSASVWVELHQVLHGVSVHTSDEGNPLSNNGVAINIWLLARRDDQLPHVVFAKIL